jgi:hypothetical protein
VITELDIGAVGTDFARWTSWWSREDLEGAKTSTSTKAEYLFEMYTNAKKCPNMYRMHLFLDEAGRILNKKIMPDVTIMVPELEMVKHCAMGKCGGTRNFQILHTRNTQFLMLVVRNSWVQVPK